MQLGISLTVDMLAGEPSAAWQTALLKDCGGVDGLLDALQTSGITAIELRDLRMQTDTARARRAIAAIQEKGLALSLHIALEAPTADAFLAEKGELLAQCTAQQEKLVLVVHSLTDAALTAATYAAWRDALHQAFPAVRLALENMRMTKPEHAHYRLAPTVAAVQAVGGDGVCWDMGHYAYNAARYDGTTDLLPPDACLQQVIHTHIHSMAPTDRQTHHPLRRENEPAILYSRALQAQGYTGIYNLELSPERFTAVCSATEGIFDSITVLQEALV